MTVDLDAVFVLGQTVQIKHVILEQYKTRKSEGTTGFTIAIREHYLSHVLLTVKQLCSGKY